MQFGSLLLKTDHINTKVLVEATGRFFRNETLLMLDSAWHSFSRDGYWQGFW